MTVEFEYPKGVTGPPIILVTIEDNGCVIADAIVPADFLKSLPVNVVTNDLVLKVNLPVNLYSSRNMPLGIESPILI